jgi:peptidyl-prolyl cis-trans isomerase D
MLNSMRKNLKKLSWTLWLVIATFIGTIFAVWGIGGNKEKSDRDVVASIDKVKVSSREFYETQRRVREFYQRIWGDKYAQMEAQLQIADTALNQIIQVQVLIKAAGQLGITYSMEDIKKKIMTMAEFQENGAFSRARYQRLLKYSHLSESEFIQQLKADLSRERVENLVKDSIWLSDDEVKDDYRMENEQVRLEYIQINARGFADKVNPTDEQIKAHFEENKANYQIPEKVSIRYIVFDPNQVKKSESFLKQSQAISDQDVDDYYYEHESSYRTEKEVRASHILFKSDGTDPAKDAAAKAKADEVLAKIKAGSDFAEMAKQFSEDSSAAQGGDVGFFPRQGKMVEQFSEAAFGLPVNQVSEVVKTNFGYHIIKATEIREASLKTLDSVKDEIKNNLLTAQATEYAERESDRLKGLFDSAAGLDPLAKRINLTVEETGLFGRKEVIPKMGWAPAVTEAAFELQKDQISSVIKEQDKFYLMTLKERIAAHQATIEDVKDRVRNDLVEKLCLEKGREKMKEILPRLGSDTPFSTFAEGDIVKVGDTDLFGRRQSIKGIGRDENLISLSFNKKLNEQFGPQEIRNTIYFFRLVEKKEPDWQKFEAEKENLRQKLIEGRGGRYYNAWIEQRKDKMEVTKNPVFFAKDTTPA